jgi:hypothetical protein
MFWALHTDLHIGAVRKVYSTFNFEFSKETHKFKIAVKTWNNTMETGKIPAGETQILRNTEYSI